MLSKTAKEVREHTRTGTFKNAPKTVKMQVPLSKSYVKTYEKGRPK